MLFAQTPQSSELNPTITQTSDECLVATTDHPDTKEGKASGVNCDGEAFEYDFESGAVKKLEGSWIDDAIDWISNTYYRLFLAKPVKDRKSEKKI